MVAPHRPRAGRVPPCGHRSSPAWRAGSASCGHRGPHPAVYEASAHVVALVVERIGSTWSHGSSSRPRAWRMAVTRWRAKATRSSASPGPLAPPAMHRGSWTSTSTVRRHRSSRPGSAGSRLIRGPAPRSGPPRPRSPDSWAGCPAAWSARGPGTGPGLAATALERLDRAGVGPDLVERSRPLIERLRAAALPTTFEHGDLAHPNLVRRPDGTLGAVDWERAEPDGLPLHDLTMALAYIAAAAASAGTPELQAEAFASALSGKTPGHRPCSMPNSDRLGIDRGLAWALTVVPWIWTAAFLAERTTVDWLADRSLGRAVAGDARPGRPGPGRGGLMRILYVTNDLPWPLTSGYLRHYHLIRHLSGRHAITLLSLVKRGHDPDDAAALAPFTEAVMHVPATFGRVGMSNRLAARAQGVIAGGDVAAVELGRLGADAHAAAPFDALLLSGKRTYPVLRSLPTLPLVTDLCDATSSRIRRQAAGRPPQPPPGPARRVPRDPPGGAGAHGSLGARALRLGPGSGRDRRRGARDPGAGEVGRRPQRRRPGVLAAQHGNARIGQHRADGCHGLRPQRGCRRPPRQHDPADRPGDVPDRHGGHRGTRPDDRRDGTGPPARGDGHGLRRGRPAVSRRGRGLRRPIRFGAGIQNKVLEAMAMEVPVVASPLAADGLRTEDGGIPPIDIAREPDEAAELIVAHLRAAAAGRTPARAAREYVASISTGRTAPTASMRSSRTPSPAAASARDDHRRPHRAGRRRQDDRRARAWSAGCPCRSATSTWASAPSRATAMLPTTRVCAAIKRRAGAAPDTRRPAGHARRAPGARSCVTRDSRTPGPRCGSANRLAEEWYRQLLAWRWQRGGADRDLRPPLLRRLPRLRRRRRGPLAGRARSTASCSGAPTRGPTWSIYLDAPGRGALRAQGRGHARVARRAGAAEYLGLGRGRRRTSSRSMRRSRSTRSSPQVAEAIVARLADGRRR